MLIAMLLTGLLGASPLDGLAHPRQSVREQAMTALWRAGPEAAPWLERGRNDPRPEVRQRVAFVQLMLDNGLDASMPEELVDAAVKLYADHDYGAAARLSEMPGGAALVARAILDTGDASLAPIVAARLADAVLPMIKRGAHDEVAQLLTLIEPNSSERAAVGWAVLATETGKPVPPRLTRALAYQQLLAYEPGGDADPLRASARNLANQDPVLAFTLRHRVGDEALAINALPAPYGQLIATHYARRRGDIAAFDANFQGLIDQLNRGLRTDDLADVLFLAGRMEEGLEMQEPNLAFELQMLLEQGDLPGMNDLLADAQTRIGMAAQEQERVLAWTAFTAASATYQLDDARRWLAVIGAGGVRPGPSTTAVDLEEEDTRRYLAALYRIEPPLAAELLASFDQADTRATAARTMMELNFPTPLVEHGDKLWRALDESLPAQTRLDMLEALVCGGAASDVVDAVVEALEPGAVEHALLAEYGRRNDVRNAALAWVAAAPGDAAALRALARWQDDAEALASLKRAFELTTDADLAAALALELAQRGDEPQRWATFARLIPLGEPGEQLRATAEAQGPAALMAVLEPGRRMASPLMHESFEKLGRYLQAAADAGRHAEAGAALDDMAIYLHSPSIRYTNGSGFVRLFQQRRTQAALALWDAGDIEAAVPLALEAVGVRGGDVDTTIFWIRKFDQSGRRDLHELADRVFLEQLTPTLGTLAVEPDSPMLNNRAAWLSASVDRRLDDALDWAVRASERAPESISIRDTLAEVLVRRGQWQQGLGIFEQIVAEQPFIEQHRERLAEARAVVAGRVAGMMRP